MYGSCNEFVNYMYQRDGDDFAFQSIESSCESIDITNEKCLFSIQFDFKYQDFFTCGYVVYQEATEYYG